MAILAKENCFACESRPAIPGEPSGYCRPCLDEAIAELNLPELPVLEFQGA